MLWHYVKFLETNDERYFSNYHEVLFPYKISKEKLKQAKENIFNEMVKDNFDIKNKIGIAHKIEKLKVKYNDVNRLLDTIFIKELPKEMVLQLIHQLKLWKYKVNINIDLYDQLIQIREINNALISEIESLTIELKKEQQTERVEIEEVIYNIEQGLEMNFKIDTKKTSLFEWGLMQKRMTKKIEMLNKENKKRK